VIEGDDSQDVIAPVLLLHERSVDDIARRSACLPFLASRTCRVAVLWSTCSQPIEQFGCYDHAPGRRPVYIFCYMTNRFGFELHPQDIRWAAAEGVSQDVIAAVLLLHEHSVDEIAPQLSAVELEQTIVLVGRSPRLYAPGTLEALESKRATPRPPPAELVQPNAVARERPRLLTTPVWNAERRPPTPAPATLGDTMRSPLSEQAQAPNGGRQSR
jgi:hypothetical protein